MTSASPHTQVQDLQQSGTNALTSQMTARTIKVGLILSFSLTHRLGLELDGGILVVVVAVTLARLVVPVQRHNMISNGTDQ